MIRENSSYDVVIIGGGLGGFETAALLAHQAAQENCPARVLLLERRNATGGRAITVEQNGFTLNYGLHYMMGGYDSAHYRVLQQIGQAEQVQFAPMDPAKIYRLRDGKLHLVPATAEDMMATELLSLEGKYGLQDAMNALFQADTDTLWNVPLKDWLDQHVSEPTLRRFFLDLAGPTAFAAVPDEISAGHLIVEARKILTSQSPLALYPAGGWGAVIDACRQAVEAAGGEVRLKARVDGLAIEDGQVTGVWSGGSLIRARAVVLALPPAEMAPILREHNLPDLSAQKLESIRPVMGVAVDLGFKGVENTKVATIEMPEDSATSGFHNLFQPQLAPEGGLLFQGLRWLTGEQMADEAEVRRTEEIFLTRLSAIFPGIREKVVLRRTLVRPVILGADHHYTQPRSSLLPVKVHSTGGLYVVGDATDAPGELSATVGESALMAARHVQEQLAAQPEGSLANS